MLWKEVNLLTFTTENWKEILIENTPDLLFVESAWRGNFGAWEYKIAKYNNQDKTPLFDLLRWCKENNIPTVFWNKEDPIHFEKFIDTAKLFDCIFTTDADMIPNYQKNQVMNAFLLCLFCRASITQPNQNTRET
ncbi:hypothetical protein F6Y02_08630 [Bacillus megaterium]|nr:hypothetical protein [Priestia megaterium]